MTLNATIGSDFQPVPPLDYPLRLAFEFGRFGFPRLREQSFPPEECCSDHFAAINPTGNPGLHQIHEAIDLFSSEGACVYAAYAGTIVDKRPGKLVIDHQGTGEGYGTQYLHIDPGPKGIGDNVIKGEPIATVKAHDAGDHLHFELWHWITASPSGNPDADAVPVDPTRLLYHWEQELALDYATLGTIDSSVTGDLDAATPSPALAAAYNAAGIDLLTSPVITVLATGCVWRITGADATHLLRSERGRITVLDEAYGSRTVTPVGIDRIGMTSRRGYPTYLVDADDTRYGVPLHQAGPNEQRVVDLLGQAFEHRYPVELEIRRSAYWGMDGSIDDYAALITGVRIG